MSAKGVPVIFTVVEAGKHRPCFGHVWLGSFWVWAQPVRDNVTLLTLHLIGFAHNQHYPWYKKAASCSQRCYFVTVKYIRINPNHLVGSSTVNLYFQFADSSLGRPFGPTVDYVDRRHLGFVSHFRPPSWICDVTSGRHLGFPVT